MNKRLYLLFLLFAISLAGLYFLFHRGQVSGPKLGALAPDFSLPNRQGQSVALSGFRGQVVLLNFWATWCGPCQQEMPSLEGLAKRFAGRKLQVLGVSLDEEGWTAIDDFLKQVPVSFPVLLDEQQTVSDRYQVYRIPETYLIDPEGKVVDKFVGPQNYENEVFAKKIERYLPQP
ncbi:MAG: TlpA disulfide reductase family protein [bacterium]